MTARLSVERLNAFYGESHILRNVDLQIAPGEVVCLIGRNGVGKTTLLRSLIGLLPLRSGQILLDGADVTGSPVEQRALCGVGYVPQGREIFANLSVHENLLLAAQAHRLPAVPESVYTLFPVLQTLLRRRGGDLSGGQQQQLAIARALVSKPKLLLLDEPTEGIQPSIIQEIERAIGSIKALGTTSVLLVEQYLQFAWRLADRYYVMERGSIVAAGPTTEPSETIARRYLTI